MNTLTASSELIALLLGLRDTTEIRDSSRKILGTFTPRSKEQPLVEIDEAEQLLASELHTGLPLSEVWRELNTKQAAG